MSKRQNKVPNPGGISQDTLTAMCEMMLRIRMVEEKVVEVYPEQEMRCPTHLSIGQEAAAVGVCSSLEKDDLIFSTHRCHAHYLAKGGDVRGLFAELYGKKTGCTGGRGGSMHLTDESVGMMGTSAIVGGAIPLAVGAALTFKMKRTARVAVCFLGDAGVEQGVFHESLNFAALKKLPVIFVCENNLYAVQTKLAQRQVINNIHKRGEIYGIPGQIIDGNDVVTVYLATKQAVERCRGGDGPALIEMMTYRWYEHVGPNFDWDMGYRSREEVEGWIRKCPVKNYENQLLASKILTQAELELMSRSVSDEVNTALAIAKSDPFPSESELFDNVY